jgi:hypothetical protein
MCVIKRLRTVTLYTRFSHHSCKPLNSLDVTVRSVGAWTEHVDVKDARVLIGTVLGSPVPPNKGEVLNLVLR